MWLEYYGKLINLSNVESVVIQDKITKEAKKVTEIAFHFPSNKLFSFAVKDRQTADKIMEDIANYINEQTGVKNIELS